MSRSACRAGRRRPTKPPTSNFQLPSTVTWELEIGSWALTGSRLARRVERPERTRGVDDLPATHRHHRFDPANLIDGHRHVVLRQHGKVGELAGFERAAHALVMRYPCAARGVEAKRVGAARRLFGSAEGGPSRVLSIDEPLKHRERVVRRDTMRIGTRADRDADGAAGHDGRLAMHLVGALAPQHVVAG